MKEARRCASRRRPPRRALDELASVKEARHGAIDVSIDGSTLDELAPVKEARLEILPHPKQGLFPR